MRPLEYEVEDVLEWAQCDKVGSSELLDGKAIGYAMHLASPFATANDIEFSGERKRVRCNEGLDHTDGPAMSRGPAGEDADEMPGLDGYPMRQRAQLDDARTNGFLIRMRCGRWTRS